MDDGSKRRHRQLKVGKSDVDKLQLERPDRDASNANDVKQVLEDVARTRHPMRLRFVFTSTMTFFDYEFRAGVIVDFVVLGAPQ